ncbi:hypothetical protein SynBIOSE41_01857 [Synechococcus sp. BIOS-E4-1]|nr:hypothetical protein SynBIOSE41_01857 [Synechococcus sp. BIOS-E4-1]
MSSAPAHFVNKTARVFEECCETKQMMKATFGSVSLLNQSATEQALELLSA